VQRFHQDVSYQLEAATAPAAAPRRVTPSVGPWREHLIHTVAIIAVVYATYWIYWRWMYTINTDGRAIVPSLFLILAETWAYINMCMFVFMTWRLKERDPGPPIEGATVDVWITCYDEPLEVLRRTAIGARAIRYPHRTYMLDDGKRDEVMAMAEELGIGYIRRVGNANAKAGNLNYALSVTSGDFILQLDSDHVPLPSIVERMLGYFRDPQMALVQTPQDFYNVDSFTHVVNDEGRRLWEENRIFYSLIQPGRDHWNASFFCGSCGLIRRTALESIAGFHSQSIIEDMETTISLHAAGWKTAYHNETLAYGLAPASADAYHVQRHRWGQGAMQILRKLKPLTRSDLTLAQRINYFAGTACYFEGWQKLVFYMMPLIFFFTGILPVSVSEHDFIIRLVPYVFLMILAFELLSRGTGYILLSERYTMVRFFTYTLAAFALFTKKPLRFNVTPKGRTAVPFRTYAPQLTLLVLSVAAPIWATIAYNKAWINYASAGWGAWSFWLNGFWALWNCFFAASVVRHSLAMRQQRRDHRFIDQLPVQVRAELDNRPVVLPAMTADLNPYGLRFRATERLEPDMAVSIQLPLAGGKVWTSGTIRYVTEEDSQLGRIYSHGVAFTNTPIEVRDAIELHCTQHAVPIWRQRYRQSIDIVTRASEAVRNTRRERRRTLRLPAHVAVALDSGGSLITLPEMFIIEDMSSGGAQLIGDLPLTPGTQITFDVPGAAVSGGGIVRHVRELRTPMATLFAMGIELNAVPLAERLEERESDERNTPGAVA
jgi:cellulose synthase (UDP-forming)